uniref:Uncharacterized protein n=1 Tax=Emiliania huxleyi TaxID=2903 RepID=A0A6V2THG5_EMIHU|mmetsp:Transcript_1389/g.3945  ORF Transcript_1389/g.3945 Transcript_1389/m.3945 type:complete len:465 (+) Transcript_1389:90-1484(+)
MDQSWAAAEQAARGGHLVGRRLRIVAMKARKDLLHKCGEAVAFRRGGREQGSKYVVVLEGSGDRITTSVDNLELCDAEGSPAKLCSDLGAALMTDSTDVLSLILVAAFAAPAKDRPLPRRWDERTKEWKAAEPLPQGGTYKAVSAVSQGWQRASNAAVFRFFSGDIAPPRFRIFSAGAMTFEAAAKYEGERPGFLFSWRGQHGLGYYADSAAREDNAPASTSRPEPILLAAGMIVRISEVDVSDEVVSTAPLSTAETWSPIRPYHGLAGRIATLGVAAEGGRRYSVMINIGIGPPAPSSLLEGRDPGRPWAVRVLAKNLSPSTQEAGPSVLLAQPAASALRRRPCVTTAGQSAVRLAGVPPNERTTILQLLSPAKEAIDSRAEDFERLCSWHLSGCPPLPPSLRAGARVRVRGLLSEAALNGCAGTIQRWDPTQPPAGRWIVKMDGQEHIRSCFLVQAENLAAL